MSFWSLLGLASKKEFDIMSQKLSNMTILMESLIQQNKIMNNSITLVDDHVNNEFQKMIVKNNEAINTICESDIKNSSLIIDLMKNLSETSSNDLMGINTELDVKFTFANDSLREIIKKMDIKDKKDIVNYENANQKLDAILTSISVNTENISLNMRKEIKEQFVIAVNAISMAISILEEQGKNNEEKLKDIEMLSSKLLETVKIIWIDNMVDNLQQVTEYNEKIPNNKFCTPI